MTEKGSRTPVPRTGFKRLPKWLRVTIWIMGVIILLLVIAVLGATWYINANKAKILKNVTKQFSEKMEGKLTIEDMEPTIWKNFPHFSLNLKKVVLTDSLYDQHKIAMFDIGNVYLQLDMSTILTPNPEIEKVTIADGSVHFFIQANGYSNTYLLRPKEPKKEKKKKAKQWNIDYLTLENLKFTSEDAPKNKQFEVMIGEIESNIKQEGGKWNIEAATDVTIGQLGFKLSKGGFLVNTKIKGNMQFIFDKNNKDLTISKRPIKANGENVNFSGVFHFGEKPVTFSLIIDAPEIDFKKGRGMLNKHIQSKLSMVEVKEPLKILATIDGKFAYPDTPTVRVNFSAKENTLSTGYGDLEKATFSGFFNNEVIKGAGHSDHNTEIQIASLHTEWQGLPIHADSIQVMDLLTPHLKFHLWSDFPVKQLNDILDNAYNFSGGNAKMNLYYSGPVLAQSNDERALKGDIYIRNATFTYVPRRLTFDKGDIHLHFSGEDLYFRNITLNSKGNTIHMDGMARRFMNVYFNDPAKVLIDWNITGNTINLNDFASFLGKRGGSPAPTPTTKAVAKVQTNAKIRMFNQQINELLSQGSMNLNIGIKKIIYDKFAAENIKAKVALLESGIRVDNLHVMHAGGALDFAGNIDQSKSTNPFNMKIKVVNAKVDSLFAAFNSFGIKSLTEKNIHGIVSASVDLSGGITDAGKLIPDSYTGNVDFMLTEGALYNFEPLVKIQKFAFKKRNLDSVTLKPLKGIFKLENQKVTMEPMSIETSALNINVKGVYGLNGGTDVNVEIPLRNPEKDKKRVLQGLEAKPKKGLVIYLRAQDGDDGKLKVSWDPMKKGWNGGDDADAALAAIDEEEAATPDTDSTKVKTNDTLQKKNKTKFRDLFRRKKEDK